MPVHEPSNLLARLLDDPREGPRLEFKVNDSDPDEIGWYVSAVAKPCDAGRAGS